MAKQSKAQKDTVERVMHEFKEGELESGNGAKVKSRKQAIAIALNESGASKYSSPAENQRKLARTKRRERQENTAEAAAEGKPKPSSADASPSKAGARSKAELYAEARKRDIAGRSKMSRDQLERSVG